MSNAIRATRPKTVLVTGATGNVGRNVVTQLLSEGHRVCALTRNPASAQLPAGVQVFRGDLNSPATLPPLEPVDAAFLVWRSRSIEAIPQLVNQFKAQVRRVVFLSSSAVRDGVEQQSNPIAWMHAEIERHIQNSGLEWTFLRPGGFATNALTWWAPQIRRGYVVRWPYAGAATPPIHEADIAAVAVRALTEEGQAGTKYVLTGPESLTQRQQVEIIGQAIGRPLQFEEVAPQLARADLEKLLPAVAVDMLLEAWSRAEASPVQPTTTVTDVTGAPARTFQQWALDHAEEFALTEMEELKEYATAP